MSQLQIEAKSRNQLQAREFLWILTCIDDTDSERESYFSVKTAMDNI